MQFNASRIVDAISRIGYTPTAALMDIVDNSVMAGAMNIVIEFDIDEGVPVNKKNNVVTYRVVDNGVGMNEAALLNALTLGSSADYCENSLSKYGMGLKSAGFSLGKRICVITKTLSDKKPITAFVDKNMIREDEGYYIYQPDIDDSPIEQRYLSVDSQGSVVEIQDVHTPHEAALTTINNLTEKLGVTYYGFLSRDENPIKIIIKYLDKSITVEPHDMLFKDGAKNEYIADDYDYVSTYLTHKGYKIELEDAPDADPVTVNVALFPRAQMSNYGGFSKEEKAKVASYKVNSKNKGFFIYRNGRLIRWGDSLSDGKGGSLISRDDFNLRVSLEFESQHDDALHVDVSKQRFDIPAQLSDALKEILAFPKDYAKEIRDLCTQKYKEFESREEGGSFNERNSELVEEDPFEFIEPIDKETLKERIKKITKETAELSKETNDEKEKKEYSDQEKVIPRKVRYSEKIVSQNIWEVGHDALTGAYVVINKNHPYYGAVFSNMNEASPERQSLEALFWSFAAAESNVRTKMKYEDEVIKDILERFKMDVGYNVTHWVRSNIDLFS